MTRVVVQGADVRSCRFLNCKILEKLDFRDCHFSEYLRFSKCSGAHLTSIDHLCSFSKTYTEQLYLNVQPGLFSAPTWTSIRFMLKLPVPKIGFSLLGAVAILIPLFKYLSLLFFERLNAARATVGLIEIAPIFVSIPSNTVLLFGLLVLLVCVSVVHSVFEPAKIRSILL